MEPFAQYILSVGAAGLMCALVSRLGSGGATGKVLKLVSGLFMLLTLLQPLTGFKIGSLTDYFEIYASNAKEAVAIGENQTNLSVRNRIKEALASYILDKGAAHGAHLTVQVQLDEAFPPNLLGITIAGDIAPYAKHALLETLCRELGLEKEDVVWQ